METDFESESNLSTFEYEDEEEFLIKGKGKDTDNVFESVVYDQILLDNSSISNRAWADCCAGNTRGIQRINRTKK
ncbi:MAG: hypothetical protein ACP5M8_07550 [Caldisphaera sp.]